LKLNPYIAAFLLLLAGLLLITYAYSLPYMSSREFLYLAAGYEFLGLSCLFLGICMGSVTFLSRMLQKGRERRHLEE
jgi:hypothetical protein